MPNYDIEVFEHLTADQQTPAEIDYLTYAVFAFRKSQWIEHFKKRNEDKLPTQAEIDNWIAELTEYDFTSMREQAAEFFRDAAAEYLHDYIEQQNHNSQRGEGHNDASQVITTMPQMQLWIFWAIVTAFIVCGCPLKETLRPPAPDEHEPGCFALEEERGIDWKGSGGTVPSVKEAKPSL